MTRRPRRCGFAAARPHPAKTRHLDGVGRGRLPSLRQAGGDGRRPHASRLPPRDARRLASGGGVSRRRRHLGGGAGSGGGVISRCRCSSRTSPACPCRIAVVLEVHRPAGGRLRGRAAAGAFDRGSRRRGRRGCRAAPRGRLGRRGRRRISTGAGGGVSSVGASRRQVARPRRPPPHPVLGQLGRNRRQTPPAHRASRVRGSNVAVFAPSADIHSASALSSRSPSCRPAGVASRVSAATGRALQESELGKPAGEFVDPLDRQIDAVGLRRPRPSRPRAAAR